MYLHDLNLYELNWERTSYSPSLNFRRSWRL